MRNPKKGKKKAKKPPQAAAAAAAPSGMETDQPSHPAVWRPGVDGVDEGEVLQYDPTAYDCLHPFSMEWPCLSFDVLRDHLGGPRAAFPHTLFLVAGTQAAHAKSNTLTLLKLANLGQGRHGKHAKALEDSDADDMSDSEDEDEDGGEHGEGGPPLCHARSVAHPGGCVNRVRAAPHEPALVAAWSEAGQVQVWDLSAQLAELAAEAQPRPAAKNRPLQLRPRGSFSHSAEGYGLDWSAVARGALASGDTRGKLHVWTPTESGWSVSGGYAGHGGSVEDVQWSPTEATVLATAGVDKTVRIWDTRERARSMLSVTAHAADVNVIGWNRLATYMLASGGDDAALKVWDLRNLAGGEAVASFNYHRAPVTSVEWCPGESSTLATTAADHTLAVWDLAVERDPEEEAALGIDANAAVADNVPPQLLFLHAGQQNPKEAHWHAQIPGMLVCTAEDGFNVFKPYNLPGDTADALAAA